MIYDFTSSFFPKPRQLEILIQKLNHHFSHTRSRFSSILSHEEFLLMQPIGDSLET